MDIGRLKDTLVGVWLDVREETSVIGIDMGRSSYNFAVSRLPLPSLLMPR